MNEILSVGLILMSALVAGRVFDVIAGQILLAGADFMSILLIDLRSDTFAFERFARSRRGCQAGETARSFRGAPKERARIAASRRPG